MHSLSEHRHEEHLFHSCVRTVGTDVWSQATEILPRLGCSVRTAIQHCLERRPDALDVIALRATASTEAEVRNVCRTILEVLRKECALHDKQKETDDADDGRIMRLKHGEKEQCRTHPDLTIESLLEESVMRRSA